MKRLLRTGLKVLIGGVIISNKRDYNLIRLYFPYRVVDRLSQINSYPMTVVEASSGFGKTTAIRAFFSKSTKESLPVYWHIFLGEGFSTSWKNICEILAKIDHECGEKLLELGIPNEDSIPLITATLGNVECNEETYIVLGKFQDIKISFSHQIMEAFGNPGGENLHVVIVTQQLSIGGTLIVSQNHRIYKVSLQDLTFTKADVGGYYKKVGLHINAKQLKNVYL